MNWKWIAVALVGTLSGCDSSGISPLQDAPPSTSQVDPTLFEKITDTAFVDSAVRGAGKGGVWNASAYRVRPGRSVRVYRVHDGYRNGRWWALPRPSGTKHGYRSDFAICPEWNKLDSLLTCTLAETARVVIGPGESALCDSGGYGRSDSLQVFMNSPSNQVADCQSTPIDWP